MQVESSSHCPKVCLLGLGLSRTGHTRRTPAHHRGRHRLILYTHAPCHQPSSSLTHVHQFYIHHSMTRVHLSVFFFFHILCTHVSQSCLFECLQKTKLIIDSRSCHYARCGRTDKGVSAFGQVSEKSEFLAGKM